MDLNETRAQIDNIDSQILNLFLKRMELAKNAMLQKKRTGNPILDKSRERKILTNVSEKSGDMDFYSRRLFKELMLLSRSYQNKNIEKTSDYVDVIKSSSITNGLFPKKGRIACQGVEGSYSQQATDKLFPQGDIMFFKTFEGVCDSVLNGLCDYGILPIENSTKGSVHAVYDLLKQGKISIIRSTKLCINHKFLATEGTKLQDIKEVISHEQALGQCSNFIKELPSNVKITMCANTALAAKIASQNKGVAAIASLNCSKLYGLRSVTDRNIQNTDNNYTRFICISPKPIIYPGSNKISFIVTCKHAPGELFKILSIIDSVGVNITKLESKPIPSSDFNFMFIFEIEANILEPEIPELLYELEQTCDSFVFLGNYMEV